MQPGVHAREELLRVRPGPARDPDRARLAACGPLRPAGPWRMMEAAGRARDLLIGLARQRIEVARGNHERAGLVEPVGSQERPRGPGRQAFAARLGEGRGISGGAVCLAGDDRGCLMLAVAVLLRPGERAEDDL